MQEILLVDGYNILNSWKELNELKEESLEHARIKLIELLLSFAALENLKLVIVFDGHKVKGNIGSIESYPGAEVIYTKEGETADSVIEKIVHQLSTTAKITVATSDWEEQKIVLGKGALRMSARELEVKVKHHLKKANKFYVQNPNNLNWLDSLIDSKTKNALEKLRRGFSSS